MSGKMDGQPRHMKFPYTTTAQIVQFPFKFYFKNNWAFRYYMYGIVASMPLFYWIQTKVNSPEAIAAHRERLRKEAALEAEHGFH